MMQIRACSFWHIAMGVAALTVPKLPADAQESGCAAECRLQVEHITCTTHTTLAARPAQGRSSVEREQGLSSTLPKPRDQVLFGLAD